MTRIQPKRRPLTRDTKSFRDDRLFYVACDDTFAPKQYFDLFQLSRVHVFVISTPPDGSCAASQVLKRLLSYEIQEGDERWMLLDTDHYSQGTHLRSFVAALAEARQKGVKVALSKPSFELWLLLHHVEETDLGSLPTAGDVEKALRAKLGEYNKTNLKREHYPPASVRDAYKRAERLDSTVTGGEIPSENTTRVYRLLKAIVSKALPQQLRLELRDLL
jgi:hypothetical protein